MLRTVEAAIHLPLFLANPDLPLNTPGASWVPPLNELDHNCPRSAAGLMRCAPADQGEYQEM